MKRWVLVLLVATTLISALVPTVPASSAAPCTGSTVVGDYTVNLTGSDSTGAALVEHAVVVFSPDGRLFLSDQPTLAAATQPIGTWTITADCFLTVLISDDFTGAIRFAKAVGYVSIDGQLIQFVTSSNTLAQMSGQALRNP